jgi:hypothetical protein
VFTEAKNKKSEVIVNAYEDETNRYDALAEVLRAIVDELSYYVFLPGNDCKVIDAVEIYKIAKKLEELK